MKRILLLRKIAARSGPEAGRARKKRRRISIGLCSALYLICLCPSAPAQRPDPETPACTHANIAAIEISLPNIIMRRMRQIQSEQGKAASLFLGKHPNIPLSAAFADPARAARLGRRTIPSEVFMLFTRSGSESLFSINHAFLHSGVCDEKCFITSPKIQREFADAISGSFVHEVSHARDIEAQPDMPYLQESEVVAYYREHIFLLDALKAIPEFDKLAQCLPRGRQLAGLKDRYFEIAMRAGGALSAKEYGRMKQLLQSIHSLKAGGTEAESASRLEALILMEKLSVSNADFEARVRDMYPDIPGIYGDPEGNIVAAGGKQEKARADYHKLKADKGRQEPGASQPAPELHYQRLFNTYENERLFWTSPERRGKAKAYFELSLTSLRSEMDRRRLGGELELFKPLSLP